MEGLEGFSVDASSGTWLAWWVCLTKYQLGTWGERGGAEQVATCPEASSVSISTVAQMA